MGQASLAQFFSEICSLLPPVDVQMSRVNMVPYIWSLRHGGQRRARFWPLEGQEKGRRGASGNFMWGKKVLNGIFRPFSKTKQNYFFYFLYCD